MTQLIPDISEEITEAWLTDALRTRGWLQNGKIARIDREILGEGAGFLGVIVRMRLSFEGDPGGAPESVIAKLPTASFENRVMGEMLGGYWREIHFYRELAKDLPTRVPDCYYADLTPDPLREKSDDLVQRLDRVPGWLVGLLMVVGSWLVRRNAHRYVLLIEDLAPAEVGDQSAGADPATCARVLAAAARLHAAYWNHPALDDYFWIARQQSGPRTRHRLYQRVRKQFRARYADLLQGERLNAADWLDRNSEALCQSVHTDAPHTLIHCDLRFDNIFLEPNTDLAPGADQEGVILADWQMVGRGAAAYDVAYFLSGVLRTDESPEVERDLLDAYHEALVAQGVSDYPFDAFLRDYRRALFAVLQIIGSTDQVELGEARGREMMDRWVERCLTLIARVPLETVL
jgi:hypothetical protein